MDSNTVIDYIVNEVKYFPSAKDLVVEEIGDGNINYVFRIKNTQNHQSVIVKQADRLLRSSGRPLDLHRNAIEVSALQIEGELTPEFVPKVYHYGKCMYACAMEDISKYKNLRKELMSLQIFPHFSDYITSFIVDTTLPTTDLVLDRRVKKERVKFFTNYDCCDISEDLVFTEPYYDYKKRNIITKGNETYVKDALYSDELLKSEVGVLRDSFMNHTQALIHGDLHSGSIFIGDDGMKVIDPEFAFYGPIGYDIGNVLGNLFFAYRCGLEKNNMQFIQWITTTIEQVWDLTYEKLQKKLRKMVRFPLYNEEFQQRYVQGIMSDALGFAGTEIIRRVVGDSKVEELDMLIPSQKKIYIERSLIEIGKWMILHRKAVRSGSEIIAHACKEIAVQNTSC